MSEGAVEWRTVTYGLLGPPGSCPRDDEREQRE